MASNPKTGSEKLFERFLSANGLPFEPVLVSTSPRPDYLVGEGMEWGPLFVEIKELVEDDNFKGGNSSRKIGDHIRSKVSQATKQVQFGASQDVPSILLIYNAIDPLHMFGTETHDFRAAMHGDWTLVISRETHSVVGAGYGRNQSFRDKQNTSFTALGHLYPHGNDIVVRLFPNIHAKVPLPKGLPQCFEIQTEPLG